MVRRAERGVGLAIRKGQAEGTVQRTGEHRFQGNQHGVREVAVDDGNSSTKVAVREIASQDELSSRVGIYGVTDGVSDAQFDEALAEAKGEGNLSRANVVRKVRDETPPTAAGSRHEVLRGAASG